MASVVEVCNLALGYLGDRATVASIDPPEGSAQAEHCARFYPIARDTLLELARPSFAMRRAALSPLVDTPEEWGFAYAVPSDAITVLAVVPPGEADDAGLAPGAFVLEADASGQRVIYTHVEQAQVRYVARVEDTARFSPLFTAALSWYLASMLAGPVVKGDAGEAAAQRCLQRAMAMLAQATGTDGNQRHVRPAHTPAHFGVR